MHVVSLWKGCPCLTSALALSNFGEWGRHLMGFGHLTRTPHYFIPSWAMRTTDIRVYCVIICRCAVYYVRVEFWHQI